MNSNSVYLNISHVGKCHGKHQFIITVCNRPHHYESLKKLRTLRDSVTRFFSVGFLHQIASPGPFTGTLGQFQFLLNIYGDLQINVSLAVYDTLQNGDSAVYHTPQKSNSVVYHTQRNVNSAVYHTQQNVNSAVYHTQRNVNSAVYHTQRNVNSGVYHTLPSHTNRFVQDSSVYGTSGMAMMVWIYCK